MPDSQPVENDFLTQITALVEKNLANEQFGVSELAEEMSMSRSNLLRKVKKVTALSVSQLISQVRLKRAMELLRKSSFNVSEVAHQVGFGSPSYFIKCFREFYGYPPGEVGKREEAGLNVEPAVPQKIPGIPRRRNFYILGSLGLVVAVVAGLFAYSKWPLSTKPSLEKSIAVLPFKNDSNDSTNVYLINGLMESTLNNLQKIKDLKVISRTSSEKYRNSSRSIPEMAKELNVNYFVEGSGQKIGDHILLNIQLIEAATDKHLWSRQYRREGKDIFELQEEIAKDIAGEIQVIITPDEATRIEKKLTDDLVAYDLFLKGREEFHKGGRENLEASIVYFKKAIERDSKFASAYAAVAIVYYYLDAFLTEKKYGDQVGHYSDKAVLLDPKLAESLVAKAVFYVQTKEYDLALPYLEKALEYNPNSILVINFLSEFYNIYTPNSAKYLENALKGIRLDIAAHDSTTASYIYLHLSNAFIQTGFIDESIKYIDKSLAYNPENPFSTYVGILFRVAKDKNLAHARELLIKELNKDTTRLEIVKEIAKLSYYLRDYEGAYNYYKRFIELREIKQLDIFKNEDINIAFVLSRVDHKQQADQFAKSFKEFADADRSIYKQMHLAFYDLYLGNDQQAIEHLAAFSKEDNYQYWVLLFPGSPEVDRIRDRPEFKKVMHDIETKFWNAHEKIQKNLEEKGLL